jgi:hypothetical protein
LRHFLFDGHSITPSSLGINLAVDPMPSANPCMASMEVDPELSDTLMHLSDYIFRAAINAGLRRK